MVSHGVPCCFGARNIIITAMMNYCNVWCLKSLVPLGSGMKNDVLDQQKPIQRFKHFYSGVPLGLSAKTNTNHDIFDLVISVYHWGNPVARTFAEPTLRQCAMLFWIKTEDLQGLKRLGVVAKMAF